MTVWVVQRYDSEGQLHGILATEELANEAAERLAKVYGSADSIVVDEWDVHDAVPADILRLSR